MLFIESFTVVIGSINKTVIDDKVHRKQNCIRKGLFEVTIVQDTKNCYDHTCVLMNTHMNTHALLWCVSL